MIGKAESTITIYFGHENGWKSKPQGYIRIEPHIWLLEKGGLGNLRKMLKLSAESDREHGTATLAAWEQAICDLYQERRSVDVALANAAFEHKLRLRGAAEWREARLQKEEERFQRAKVHRGKSHAERVREIEEKYRQMIAADERRLARETEQIRRRAVRARELTEAQLREVRKWMEAVAA